MKPVPVSLAWVFQPHPAHMFAEILPDMISNVGDCKIGALPKDKPTGKLVDEWNQA